MQVTAEFMEHLDRNNRIGKTINVKMPDPHPRWNRVARESYGYAGDDEPSMYLSTNFWYGYAAGAMTIVIAIIVLVSLDII